VLALFGITGLHCRASIDERLIETPVLQVARGQECFKIEETATVAPLFRGRDHADRHFLHRTLARIHSNVIKRKASPRSVRTVSLGAHLRDSMFVESPKPAHPII